MKTREDWFSRYEDSLQAVHQTFGWRASAECGVICARSVRFYCTVLNARSYETIPVVTKSLERMSMDERGIDVNGGKGEDPALSDGRNQGG